MTNKTKRILWKTSILICFLIISSTLLFFASCSNESNFDDQSTDTVTTSLPTSESEETVFPSSTDFAASEKPKDNIISQPETDGLATGDMGITEIPSEIPVVVPETSLPTSDSKETEFPISTNSAAPTSKPTSKPTAKPTATATSTPTPVATAKPTAKPTATATPTASATSTPSTGNSSSETTDGDVHVVVGPNGITFVKDVVIECEHDWELTNEKISDGFSYVTEIDSGYKCDACDTIVDDCYTTCPHCGVRLKINPYFIEEVVVEPALYKEYYKCTKCQNVKDVKIVEESELKKEG